MTKPTPSARVAKSMLYLLSRSSPEVGAASPDGFIEARFVMNWKAPDSLTR
jgi:hypothetical protein